MAQTLARAATAALLAATLTDFRVQAARDFSGPGRDRYETVRVPDGYAAVLVRVRAAGGGCILCGAKAASPTDTVRGVDTAGARTCTARQQALVNRVLGVQ